MSFTPSYDDSLSMVGCTVTMSYLSPVGNICTVVFDNVHPNKLQLIKRIINSK